MDMTVSDLIVMLQEYPPDTIIYVEEGWYCDTSKWVEAKSIVTLNDPDDPVGIALTTIPHA